MKPQVEGRTFQDGSAAEERPDRETLHQIKDIFNLFASAVAAIKIFSSRHENVLKVADDILAQLAAYLDHHLELEIGIGENFFTFRGEEVFKDPIAAKSLPYLFFKDGMQNLAFSKGLVREELLEFLEIVKTNILLPPEAGDIVDALWEREFHHIRYHAPDEFLETKIGQGQAQPYDYRVDASKLYKGKIELSPADMQEVYQHSLAVSQQKSQPDAPTAEDLAASLDKGDTLLLESMLSTERQYSTEKEFLDLVFEVIYLEPRSAQFLDLLSFVDNHHRYLIRTGDLLNANQLIDMLASLRTALRSSSPQRADWVAEALSKTQAAITAGELRLVVKPESTDPRVFYDYVKRLGPRLLLYATEIFEERPEPGWRAAGFDFLQDMSVTQMPALANMAQDRKPGLTKALIHLMASRPDRKAILQLAAFVSYTNPEIKREAIEALGAIADDLANKVLLEFLHDPDEGVRTEAAKVARLGRDRRAFEILLHTLPEKEFHEKSEVEKGAILTCLARTGEKPAAAGLQALVEKSSLFGKAKHEETRLQAVRALEVMRTPEAIEALKANVGHSNKKIAEACQKALEQLSAAPGHSPEKTA